MQAGGADIIELGVPFTDPQADGATIQGTNQVRSLLCFLGILIAAVNSECSAYE